MTAKGPPSLENPSRRRLTAGLTGTALTLGARPVEARAPRTAPPTSPPARPTEGDIPLLAFAEQIELTARDLYRVALDEGAAGDRDRVLLTGRDNHQAAADSLSAILGIDGTGERDEALFEELSGGFTTSDLPAVAEAGYALESTAVATHIGLIGQLQGTAGANTIAAILMIESRMCTVLADLQGLGDDDAALFDNGAVALVPPAAAG
ncbi:MAG: ferritin-like domain-containing protein [Actinomycetota bacterium]|nr:ferritin-like domain-containing protein [Acidimicrobiia bacterium]MDQ3468365.1 ferritin-like domain-containing protein [Actinomycetota bacterium]